jgi:signal transduction histidine kinase
MADGELLMAAPSAIGLVYWGRKALNVPARLPTWDRWLQQLWKPAAVIVGLGLLVGGPVLSWLDDFFLVAVLALGVAICWQLRASRTPLLVGLGLLPYTVVQLTELLLQAVAPALLKRLSGFDNAEGLSFVWMGIFFLLARSQQKAQLAEQALRLEAKQAQQAVESQNQTLEYEVNQRTAALVRQTDELRATLQELQATQDQLIQREKMASLGELTAGIAHEIQNPLNFVNNFADVSQELVQELLEERASPARDATVEAELLADLRLNLGRIAQHGGRASSIVRGMLEHSRTSTGERAPTDVNVLADEYMRLAYHGLRAKDKSFNATLDVQLAPNLPLVDAMAGDLGRVLLNLFTNAFYAVQQRQLTGAEPGYAPTVGVRTRALDEGVEIQVRDNGTGIPAAVQARIFQPFFTTKPVGEGTGLGLSLSHDIITQGHGGTLSVESQEGQGTTFIIQLPL